MNMSRATAVKAYEANVIVSTEGLGHQDWLNYRRNGIGGSDAAAIMGVSPFATARDLYFDKKNLKNQNPNEEEENWVAKKVGHLLEELVAEIFAKKTGLEVYPVHKMFQHPIYPFMLADVDYFIAFPDGTTGILECKTTNYNCKDKWDDNTIPQNYEYQVRHYMAVMNIDKAYIACLYGNNANEFIIRKIERNALDEEELIQEEQYFWDEYVAKGVEPPYTERPDLVLKSLQEHIGAASKGLPEMSLDKGLAKKVEKYLKLADNKKKLEVDKKRIEEEQKQLSIPIIEELGKCCNALIEDNGVKYNITYNPTYRTSIKKEQLIKLKTLHPDIYDEFVDTSESRTFRVKKTAA
jgi:putative phage-type endonuclease